MKPFHKTTIASAILSGSANYSFDIRANNNFCIGLETNHLIQDIAHQAVVSLESAIAKELGDENLLQQYDIEVGPSDDISDLYEVYGPIEAAVEGLASKLDLFGSVSVIHTPGNYRDGDDLYDTCIEFDSSLGRVLFRVYINFNTMWDEDDYNFMCKGYYVDCDIDVVDINSEYNQLESTLSIFWLADRLLTKYLVE